MIFDQFKLNISKIRGIKSVKQDNNKIVIIYQDNFTLNIDINGDLCHNFYTYTDYDMPKFWYVGKMPHNSYNELYCEIYRMSCKNNRIKKCKNNYYKSYL